MSSFLYPCLKPLGFKYPRFAVASQFTYLAMISILNSNTVSNFPCSIFTYKPNRCLKFAMFDLKFAMSGI